MEFPQIGQLGEQSNLPLTVAEVEDESEIEDGVEETRVEEVLTKETRVEVVLTKQTRVEEVLMKDPRVEEDLHATMTEVDTSNAQVIGVAKHSQVETSTAKGSTDKYSHMDCVKAKIVVYVDTGQPIQTETKDTIPCEAVVNADRHDDVPADQGGDQHWGTVGEYNLRDVPWDV